GVYKYIVNNSIVNLFVAGSCFFISLLSKESAITFLAIVPLMVYFFIPADVAGKKSKGLTATVTLAAITLIFLLIRKSILVGAIADVPMIDNYLYGIKDFISQKATAIFLMGIY